MQILTFSHFLCARTSEGEYCTAYIFTVLLARIRRVVSRQILNFGHWRVDLDLVVSTVVCAAEEHSPTKLAHFPALKHSRFYVRSYFTYSNELKMEISSHYVISQGEHVMQAKVKLKFLTVYAPHLALSATDKPQVT